MTVSELEKIHEDRIKELRELEAKIENMYRIGYHDVADHLEMISDFVIDDLIEIDKLLKEKKGANHEKSNK